MYQNKIAATFLLIGSSCGISTCSLGRVWSALPVQYLPTQIATFPRSNLAISNKQFKYKKGRRGRYKFLLLLSTFSIVCFRNKHSFFILFFTFGLNYFNISKTELLSQEMHCPILFHENFLELISVRLKTSQASQHRRSSIPTPEIYCFNIVIIWPICS